MPRGRTGLLVTISVIALFAAFVGFVTSTVELSFNVLAVLFLGAVLAVLTGFCWLVMAGPGPSEGVDPDVTRVAADLDARAHGLPSTLPPSAQQEDLTNRV
ncbi:MAG: hypothetical protein SGJ11_16745 [Phycisphaerae bacterium]|nr:hypothetical protein [Phycisphaerae bacterium]